MKKPCGAQQSLIAQEAGCTDRTVRQWRRRWVESKNLDDLPRSGALRRFSPEVRAQTTAIACSLPKETDTPLARWSVREIAKRLQASTVVTSIAASTIARWFQEEKIKPWRYHPSSTFLTHNSSWCQERRRMSAEYRFYDEKSSTSRLSLSSL